MDIEVVEKQSVSLCDENAPRKLQANAMPDQQRGGIGFPEFPMDAVMPPSGFIHDYLAWISPLTEAPDQFHFGTALATLSVALGQDCFLPFGHKRLCPNLWMVLLSPSGIYRKSTALDGGKELLLDLCAGEDGERADQENGESDIVDRSLVFADQYSPESFIDGLSEQATRLFVYSEIGTLLDGFNRQYMLGMKSMLTELYDCPRRYRQRLKKAKSIRADRPFISIMAGSTIEWLTGKLTSEDLRSGFLCRFVFISASQRKEPIPYPPAQDERLREKILSKLKDFRDAAPMEMSLSKAASEKWDEWYRTSHAELDDDPRSDVLAGFWTRLEICVLKLGILFQVSTYENTEISLDSLKRAIALVEYFKETIRHLVSEELVFGGYAKSRKRVLDMIRTTPGIEHSPLLRNSHLPSKALWSILDTLSEERSIRVETKKSGNNKDSKSYYPT